MPKIIVVVREVRRKPDLISHIRRATGLTVSGIVASLGGDRPLGQWSLFGNDHDQVATCLRELLAVEKSGEGVLEFYELQDNENFNTQTSLRLEIAPKTLNNILDAHETQRRKLDEE